MVIQYIKFKEGSVESIDYFHVGLNLLTSRGRNSVGKSTYCRLIFYALGYAVPSTEDIKFDKLYTEIGVVEGEEKFCIKRLKNELHVENKDSSFKKRYTLPNDHTAFLTFLFGVDNPEIAKNLLGLMYIDQEKGWTLLNRGKVIGNIRFSIDELVAALKGMDCEELFVKRNSIEEAIDKYESLVKMNSIKEEYYGDGDNLQVLTVPEDLRRRLASLELLIRELKNDILELDIIIKKDKDFFEYIESMNLYVRHGEELIRITKNNIENSSSTEYLQAQQGVLKAELNKLVKEKIEITGKLDYISETPNMFGENNVSLEKSINNALSTLNLDVERIKKNLQEKKDELNIINKKIQYRVRYYNEYVNEFYVLFNEYLKELRYTKRIKKDFLFTSDLKGRTGENIQKLIIAYKVAIIKVVEKAIGRRLVLVVDSPKAKELDDYNTSLIMKFIKEKLSENQVIIASIYDAKDLYVKFDKIIKFKKRAIENR